MAEKKNNRKIKINLKIYERKSIKINLNKN